MNEFLEEETREELTRNGKELVAGKDFDPRPIVKFFTPDGHKKWLIASLDPDDPDLAYGLVDLGVGEPEIGFVRLSDLAANRGPLGLLIERDVNFVARFSLGTYARLAQAEGAISD